MPRIFQGEIMVPFPWQHAPCRLPRAGMVADLTLQHALRGSRTAPRAAYRLLSLHPRLGPSLFPAICAGHSFDTTRHTPKWCLNAHA
jgi:hypothetical protein